MCQAIAETYLQYVACRVLPELVKARKYIKYIHIYTHKIIACVYIKQQKYWLRIHL